MVDFAAEKSANFAKLVVVDRRQQQQQLGGWVEMGDNQIKVEEERREEGKPHLREEVAWKRGHCH